MKWDNKLIGVAAIACGLLVGQRELGAQSVTFLATELVGRPTDSSVTVNAIANGALEVYFEYGTRSGMYSGSTSPVVFMEGSPIETVIDGLAANTEYFYRMRYRNPFNGGTFQMGAEHSFMTQRSPGSTFTFAVQSDSHQGFQPFYSSELYGINLDNVQSEELGQRSDFLVDLGDTISLDGSSETQTTVRQKYQDQRDYFDLIGHSIPVFLVPGNHENEEGWNLDDKGSDIKNSLPVLGTNARKRYFLNPIPDGFYTGNLDDSLTQIDGDHLREDYYAFEWGSALFIALDPFSYTMRKPYSGSTGGEQNDEEVGNRWDWTLGPEQYLWLKQTLEQSTSKFKFVFIHHLTGGTEDYSRGGAAGAHLCEWGGYNLDGTWGFSQQRPGWGTPIHPLLAEHGVTIVFHGHDHIFAKEDLDGVVYQECPHAANPDYMSGFASNQIDYANAVRVNNSGHLRVTVSASQVQVDYVRAFLPNQGPNNSVAYSYTVEAASGNTPPQAQDDPVAASEDQAATVFVLSNDQDADAQDVLSVAGVTQPSHGTAFNQGSYVVYEPEPDYCDEFTPDSFTYTVSDGNGGSDTATVFVTVSCAPDSPVAVDDPVSVVEDESVTIDVASNDIDVDGDLNPGSVQALGSLDSGTLLNLGDGSFEYTPSAGFVGAESFDYRICDGAGLCDTGTVNISVIPIPDGVFEFGSVTVGASPVSVNLSGSYLEPVIVASARYENNTSPVVVRVSNVGSDRFDIRLQNPSNLSVLPEEVDYLVVEQGAWTIDGVSFEAQKYDSAVTDSDGSWLGNSQSYLQSYNNPVVVGQVMSENDPDWSAFWCQGNSRTNPPSSSALVTGKMVGEDSDTTRANETIGFIVMEAGHGTMDGVEFEAALGPDTISGVGDAPPYAYSFPSPFVAPPAVALTSMAGVDGPNGGWAQPHGAGALSSTALSLSIDEDQVGDSERNHTNEQVGYIVFSSNLSNEPPIADDQAVSLDEDTAAVVELGAFDAEGDALSYNIVAGPQHGVLTTAGNNLVSYTPDPDFNGPDSFTFVANDNVSNSNVATVSINVLAVDDPPAISNQAVLGQEDFPLEVALAAADVDGEALSYAVTASPLSGTVQAVGTGFVYQPALDYCGLDFFEYSVTDGHTLVGPARVDISVACLNDAPVAVGDPVSAIEDTPLAIDVLQNDQDPEADLLSVVAVTQPSHGTAFNQGTYVVYEPQPDYCDETSPDSFNYTVSDGNGGTDTASVQVMVSCTRDDPVALDDQASVADGGSVTISVVDNDSDADGDLDVASATATIGPNAGVLQNNGDGSFEYAPVAGFVGSDSFVYEICDFTAVCVAARVDISVTPAVQGIIEFGTVSAGSNPVTVGLSGSYLNPVVVASAGYDNNSIPAVVRVGNVSANAFDVRLQNPSGLSVAPENVSYVVVEQGAWMIDGIKLEAQRYTSTVTDSDSSWVGESQDYLQGYQAPVVLGQVMSENDPDWSAFWCRGTSRTAPPSPATLFTGKMVGEDSDTSRADEIIGFIVVEAGHGTFNGVEFEAALGADTVEGVDDSPPYTYTFATPFATTPSVAVTSIAAQDGNNGGWAQTHGPSPLSSTQLALSVDEDQIGDNERNHINEQVSYIVFGSQN